MQWIQSAFSSSSSSARKSSPPKRSFKDITYFFRRSKKSRHLTRQPKLRHLSDIDIHGLPFKNLAHLPLNSDCRADLDDHLCSGRSSPVVPHPLPVPELVAFSQASRSVHFPLPSPDEIRKIGTQSDDVVDRDRITSTPTSVGDDILDRNGRNSAYQTNHKSTEHVDIPSKSPVNRGKKVLQEQNGFGNFQNSFRSNASAAISVPDSGLSSPTLSPRRMSTGESFPSPFVPIHGYVWSAPEMAAMDMYMDPFSQASSDTTLPHPERSPHHNRGAKSRSPSGAASPLHSRMSPESSTLRHENNGHANVHPLPLPPGPTVSSQTTFTQQTVTKPDSVTPGRWQKGKLIGRGTFGSVYVATNRETGALCAMKEVDLIPDDPKSAECMKQLEQEINVLSQLKHPNIVQYHGSEIVGDHFYIYLEYVYPGSINKYVREHYGAITESVVRNFTRHILHGLAYLHSTKTIHRDIKGANLLVDANGVVKLADFGMAKHLTGQTAELSMKGSPYWMAPEILHAVNTKDTNGEFAYAVDIWSLGCTIIEIVNGKPPWSEYEGAAAMFKVWKETPPIPETLSPLGKDFLQCCFRRNPAERPTASMLLEHPFMKSSQPVDFQASTLSLSAMKLGDTLHSPGEWTTSKGYSLPVSPNNH